MARRKKPTVPKRASVRTSRRHKYSRFTGGTGGTVKNEPRDLKPNAYNVDGHTLGSGKKSLPFKGQAFVI